MSKVSEATDFEFERYRNYLRLLAHMQMAEPLRGKIDPSDIAQQTLIEAHRQRERFEFRSEEETAGWLRRILGFTLCDALKRFGRSKRDLGREQAMNAAIDASSIRLEGLLAADESSPSQRALKHERLLQIVDLLGALPEGQREAVVLRFCQELSLDEIATRLGKTERAVCGLVQRGIRELRRQMEEGD